MEDYSRLQDMFNSMNKRPEQGILRPDLKYKQEQNRLAQNRLGAETRFQQNKWEDEESAMYRDENLAPLKEGKDKVMSTIMDLMKKAGIGLDDFGSLIKSAGSNYLESRKEPWE